MKYFEKSIVVGCCFVGIFILQLISMSIQPAPELILNLSNKFFYLIKRVGFVVFAFAIIMDGINYKRSRH
ncbi:hypothetical protein [Paraclostridium bifermentans]|uniref:hypothetical protein n=1 Tax=Paraclostridium bifermentans TaxID=1490 RepID=UPI00117D2ABB|nr:hypothetical protein [Paraclostridium bifermentans]